MGVAADARHAADPEVERLERSESRLLDERHNERPQTAVNVHTDLVPVCQVAECDNVIGVTIGEVDCRADKLEPYVSSRGHTDEGKRTHHDRVRIAATYKLVVSLSLTKYTSLHRSFDSLDVDLSCLRVYRDSVHLDAQICCTLVEGCMGSHRDNPARPSCQGRVPP